MLEPIKSNRINIDERIDKYFITKFIESVETDRFASEDEKKFFILSLTNEGVYKEILKQGINKYKSLEINSWVKMKNFEYLVRFTLKGLNQDRSKIAIIGYDYEEKSVSEDSLMVNPVGFFIKYYKVENDT